MSKLAAENTEEPNDVSPSKQAKTTSFQCKLHAFVFIYTVLYILFIQFYIIV